MVCVIPGGSTEQSDQLKKLSSFSRVNEMDLIRAVLTGWLDPSFLISACSKHLYICRISVPCFLITLNNDVHIIICTFTGKQSFYVLTMSSG